ncbi:MAG: PD40 domain-containing protein, partial [Acidobacteria bacterium]|nr:PD40 domain-containing protein [Acidobacteriota bacterium]
FLAHSRGQRTVGRKLLMPAASLTDLADPTSDPAFSPDGTRVAFRRQGYTPGTAGIFVKTIGSHQLLQLTNNPSDCCPAWPPNGRTIAFSRFSKKEHEILTVAAPGGRLLQCWDRRSAFRCCRYPCRRRRQFPSCCFRRGRR